MQPLAKHQTSPPSWPVLTFGPRDLEENRCLNPCTLITYLVTDPISSLGQLNELPVKCQTSAFICTLPSVYFGLKPRFFNITWHELQLGWKWSRLCTYQCKAGGEGQGMGWGFDFLCWPWGRAFDWSCSPRGGDIWIFLRPTSRYLTADSDEKDWDRTYVSRFHASRMRHTVWKDQEVMESKTSEGWVDFTVLSSNFVCFGVLVINWTS